MVGYYMKVDRIGKLIAQFHAIFICIQSVSGENDIVFGNIFMSSFIISAKL